MSRQLANRGHDAVLGAADWLSLAAAPTFALMALLTGIFGGKPDVLCAAIEGTSALSGMVPMYLLMSAFHLAPWLRLIRRARRGTGDAGSGGKTNIHAHQRRGGNSPSVVSPVREFPVFD